MRDRIKHFFSTTKTRTEDGDGDIKIIPRHVAIIMDGNGRWAAKRGLPRIAGHRAGMKTVREITEAADELGVEVLTLYAFSTENWKRPRDEVAYLMKLPVEFLATELPDLVRRNVRVQTMGNDANLPTHTLNAVQKFKEETADNTGLILNLAINYGGRSEIVHTVKKLISQVESGTLTKDDITEDTINRQLWSCLLPDPDLLIRTSGEIRLSNFMLWQSAYAEMWFTEVLWPDFNKQLFQDAISAFQSRSRRYGSV